MKTCHMHFNQKEVYKHYEIDIFVKFERKKKTLTVGTVQEFSLTDKSI